MYEEPLATSEYFFHFSNITGYAFLLYKEESSVHKLLLSCTSEADKYFISIPTSAFGRKKVCSLCVLSSLKGYSRLSMSLRHLPLFTTIGYMFV